MTVSKYRVERGRETEAVVAKWFREYGWPFAEQVGSFRPGPDLTGTPGLAVEIKARRDLQLVSWLRQASQNPGLPMVIHRPDGMGPESVAIWPVTFHLADATRLLRRAGYGDPEGDI